MQNGTASGAASIDKAVRLLLHVLEHGAPAQGGALLSAQAARAGIPPSTAQRIAATLLRHGMLSRVGHGRYTVGLRLAELAGGVDRRAVLAATGRPLLRRLAARIGATVHLGVLDADMMTYLVKEHGGGAAVLTSEMSQLEAYCSGIGKVLLAAMPEAARETYLRAGAFVALTPNTITDPVLLRAELARVASRGHALDNGEVEDGLYCLAVPVRGPGGDVIAALSASTHQRGDNTPARLRLLHACAEAISKRMFSEDTGRRAMASVSGGGQLECAGCTTEAAI
jgi:DNA-binding IclR family transcriptional regulator